MNHESCVCVSVCMFVHVFRSHQKPRLHDILAQEISDIFNPYDYEILKKKYLKNRENTTIFRAFYVWFLIHKFQNDVFINDFPSHQALKLPKIWNPRTRCTNLNYNEDRFSNLLFYTFYDNISIFRFF